MPQIRVALVGKSGYANGKVALALVNHYKFSRFRLLDGARKAYTQLHGRATWKLLHTTKKYDFYDAIHSVDKDAFTDYLRQRLGPLGEKHVVVEDARFTHEVATLKELGFVIVRVFGNPPKRAPSIGEYTGPGRVTLQEFFPHSFIKPYEADYQINFSNQPELLEHLKLLMNSLNFSQSIVYPTSEPAMKRELGGMIIEEAQRTSDPIDD